MPEECEILENVLVRTKDRKSSKKCHKSKSSKCHKPNPTPCQVNCCISDCNPDCCTLAFQRLDKLRQVWQLTQYGTVLPVPPEVYTRGGQLVVVPTTLGDITLGNLERAAYAFVNEVRYLSHEECGKLDQVIGWSVDMLSGNLYFYQDLPELGLSISDQRVVLLNKTLDQQTHYDKKKLQEMEPFWKLSMKAVERINENPKTEGNICEIKDRCGNKFLVAINRVVGQADGVSVCAYNSRYSIVVVKLC